MSFSNLSDSAIAEEIGDRLERMRLEQNRTQSELANEIGITPVSYRNLVAGKGKFENIIALIRVLGRVDLLESFVPESEFSPMERLKMQGKRRQRASGSKDEIKSGIKPPSKAEELDW